MASGFCISFRNRNRRLNHILETRNRVLERSADREANCFLLLEEKRVVGSRIRVQREYQAERHVDDRNLYSEFAAKAVAVVIEYPCLRLRNQSALRRLLLAED